MAKLTNLKTETIHVRANKETKIVLKTLSTKYNMSDSELIQKALIELLYKD